MQCPSELAPDQYHLRSAAQAVLDCFIVTLSHSMALGLRTAPLRQVGVPEAGTHAAVCFVRGFHYKPFRSLHTADFASMKVFLLCT